MIEKRLVIASLAVVIAMMASCGGSKKNKTTETEQPKSMIEESPSYDPKRGEGKFNENNVTIGTLDGAMAAKGEAIAGTKCTSCHKLTDEKLVGPGWKGVTTRQTAHWIMNFITNPDPMINVDPELQKQLEICLVRMPNQGLNETEARQVLEYMREIDGAK